VPSATELLRRTVDVSPEQVSFLQFGRVADTTAARVELGFAPRWSSLQAFEDFAARLTGVVTEERVARVERDVMTALRSAAAWLSGEVRT
jgi:UDP-glucose 4-epimerase